MKEETIERARTAYWLNEKHNNYAKVGRIMNVTRARAKQLVEWFEGYSQGNIDKI